MGRAALCAGALSLVKKYNAFRHVETLFCIAVTGCSILLLKQNFLLPLYTKFKLLLHFVLLRYLKYFFLSDNRFTICLDEKCNVH